ncbi:hypothetical protein SK128_011821, partial [Halocaridina rubra]
MIINIITVLAKAYDNSREKTREKKKGKYSSRSPKSFGEFHYPLEKNKSTRPEEAILQDIYLFGRKLTRQKNSKKWGIQCVLLGKAGAGVDTQLLGEEGFGDHLEER